MEDSAQLHAIASERGIRYFVAESLSTPLMAAITRFAGAAFRHDYADRAAPRCEAEELTWMMAPHGSFAVLAYDAADDLIGFELACRRTFFMGDRILPAYYVTWLTVAAALRGRGIAQTILRLISQQALSERGARCLVSAFDENASGEPTVRRHARAAALTLHLSTPRRLWMATQSLARCHAYEPLRGVERAVLLPGVRHAFEFKPAARGAARLRARADPARLDPRRHHACGFLPDAGFCAMYDGSLPRARTSRFELRSGRAGSMVHNTLTLTHAARGERQVGQIECVEPGDLTAGEVAQMLRAAATRDAAEGCIATLLVDFAGWPKSLLLRAGFVPGPRSARLAIRAPAQAAGELPRLDGAIFTDLI